MAKSKPTMRTLADIVRGLLPVPVREEPSDDGVLLSGGDPGLVVVRVAGRGLTVSVYGVRWDGPHTPTRADRELCRVSGDDMPAELPEQAVVAAALIQAAVAIRRAKFLVCRYCGQSNPPEWQHGADVCQACAERHLGVVH